jgi:Mn-dependent DtxR family transcriptional regulator
MNKTKQNILKKLKIGENKIFLGVIANKLKITRPTLNKYLAQLTEEGYLNKKINAGINGGTMGDAKYCTLIVRLK